MKLDAYLRTSRVGDRDEDTVADWQREAIEEWAAAREVEIAAWHSDLNQSGGRDDRPGLDRALARVEAGEVEGIAVARLDRFSRSLAGALATIRRLDDAGGQLISTSEAIDSTTSSGELQRNILLSFADYYLATMREHWSATRRGAIEAGIALGPAPIGYRRGEGARLERDPERADVIAALFKRAATGKHGDSALARWASERMTRPGGGSSFAPSEVRRWLRSRTYLGEARSGELVNANAHEPLTDVATWAAAQRAPGRRSRNLGEPFPLSGIARCSHCRFAMTGQTGGGTDGKTRVYRCSRSSRGDGGGHSVIVAERLERHVEAATLARIEAMTDSEAERTQEAGDPAALAELERQVAEAESAAGMLAAAIDRDADWLAGARELAAGLDALRAERDAAAERVRVGAGLAEIRWVFVRRGRRPVEERVKIVWADDAPIDVPGNGRSGPFPPVNW